MIHGAAAWEPFHFVTAYQRLHSSPIAVVVVLDQGRDGLHVLVGDGDSFSSVVVFGEHVGHARQQPLLVLGLDSRHGWRGRKHEDEWNYYTTDVLLEEYSVRGSTYVLEEYLVF